ncbi:MAG: 30S ribosomal protein S20 [Candidatus Hydrogenedentes bacterium]|nr:30S ribosomal protein S20 [Candidatus Hydrogenedentota bacterium]
MANIKSQEKRNRTNELARQRNMAVRSKMKTFVKAAEQAIVGGGDDTAVVVTKAISEIDRAAAKGVIHKNSAARKKASLQLQLSKKSAS